MRIPFTHPTQSQTTSNAPPRKTYPSERAEHPPTPNTGYRLLWCSRDPSCFPYVSPEPPYLPSKFIRTRQETGPGPVPHVRDSIQPSISDSRGASCTHRPLRANRNVYLHEYDSSPRPGAERMSPANRFPLLGHLWFFEECYASLVGRVNRYAR